MTGSSFRLGLVLTVVLYSLGTVSGNLNAVRCDAKKPLCPLSNSHCEGNACKCNYGKGNGHFACHDDMHSFCHIINDPVARTFGHESFDLPLPCRIFVTHVSATLTYNNWFISQCQTQVYAVNGRSRGKFFVSGFDVIVEYISFTVGGLKQLHFKGTGRVVNEQYEFVLEMKEGISDNTPFSEDFDLGDYPYLGDVEFQEYPEDKKVRLYIQNCGIEVIFRPANGILGMRQDHMPGLSVAYDHGTFPNGLRWLSDDHTVCLEPDLNKCTTGKVANAANLNPSETFVYRALQAGTPQSIHFHGETEVCERVSESVKTCTNNRRHQAAMEACTFILGYPLFAHCYSEYHREYDSSSNIMSLFEDCIMSFCHYNSTQCVQVHDKIQMAGCSHKAYNSFMSHNCDFTNYA